MTGSKAHIHSVEFSPLRPSKKNVVSPHAWVAVACFNLFFSLEIEHLVQS